MAFTVNGSNHKEWEEHSLAEFGDFSDCVTYCNQCSDYGDCSRGDWFHIPDEVLPPMQGVDYGDQKPNERAIYFGTFANDHSPGASHYTYAEIFDMDDEDDVKAFEAQKKEWESFPEYIEEDEPEDEDGDTHEDDEEDTPVE